MPQSLSAIQQSAPSDLRDLLLQQMQSWQQGTRLPIETIAVKVAPGRRTQAMEALIKQEIKLREMAGETPRLEEYVSRFPECAASLSQELSQEFDMTMAISSLMKAKEQADANGIDPTQANAYSQQPLPDRPELTQYTTPGSAVPRELNQELKGDNNPTKSGSQKRGEQAVRMIGPYRLEKKLGQGGMGSVYKAIHTKLDKLVAIKVMTRNGSLDENAVERFEREMRAVGRIEHPHVIRAMDAGEADGYHFLVMEYVEGTDVSQLVKKNGPFSIGQACEIIRQAALGLHEAHLLGLIHRDIKPSNLFLTNRGVVKILDLGLARLSEGQAQNPDLTQSGLCMGTPDYMAPEQWISARDVDGRCDIYALGCTLFHLLVGRPPFGTKEHLSLGNKVLAHTSGAIPDIRPLVPDFPEGLKLVMDTMLARERNLRYATGVELAQALQPFCTLLPGADSFASSDSSSAAKMIPPKRPRSWVTNAAMWGGGALVTCLAAFIIIRIVDDKGRITEVKVPAGSEVSVAYVDDKAAGEEANKKGKSKPPATVKIDTTKTDSTRTDPDEAESEKPATDKPETQTAATQTVKSGTDNAEPGQAVVKTGDKKPVGGLVGKSTEKPSNTEVAAVTIRPVSPDETSAETKSPAEMKVVKVGAGNAAKPDPAQVPGSSDPAASKQPPSTEVAAINPPTDLKPPVEKIIPALPLRLPATGDVIARQQAAWSRELKRPVLQPNTIRMPLVLIPPGEFDMGSLPEDPAGATEGGPTTRNQPFDAPRHRVKITRPFAISQHEITLAQFRQFVASTKYKTLAERETATGVSLSEGLTQKKLVRQPGFSWQFAGEMPLEDEHPVTNISWYDAVAFCEWLSQHEGVTYRLPTEAEWEYVARAEQGTLVDGSAEFLESLKSSANLGDKSGLQQFGDTGLITRPVDWDDSVPALAGIGRLLPNALGLNDLQGNVAEWCFDRYDMDYYRSAALENPRGPAAGSARVVRGASWRSNASECRPDVRSSALPSQSSLNIGFRVVQELPNPDAPKTPSAAQRDLAVAEWVIHQGGSVRVAINRVPANEISRVEDLPKIVKGQEYTVYVVNLADTGVSDQGLSRLRSLAGLQELDLAGNPVTDAGLEKLSSFRFLQKLNLSRTQVTGAGLVHLASARKLYDLDLSCCPISETTIVPLGSLTTLGQLHLNSTPVTDRSLELLKSMPGLKELSLVDTRITGSGLNALKNLANLTLLDLSMTPLDNRLLRGLEDLKTIRQIRFNWSTISDMGLTHLHERYTLIEVGLRGTETADFNIDVLQRLKAIRNLDLRETDFTETGVADLEKSLRTKINASIGDFNARVASMCLSLGGKVVIASGPDNQLKTLTPGSTIPRGSFELREVHLSGIPVSDGVLWMLPRLPALKVLNLDGTLIDDAGVAAIAHVPGLETINLSGTRITDQSLNDVATIKSLKTLTIKNNRLTEDKVAELRSKLTGAEIQ